MRINFVCANAAVLRIFSHTNKIKWMSCPKKSLIRHSKVLQVFYKPISRTICTDSNLQSYRYSIQESEKADLLDYQDNFLKENFNISDTRYLKLVTLPKECNNLEELLWTNEFKYILSRSHFLYDVNLLENSTISYYQISTSIPHACNAMESTCENYLVKKQSVFECNKVLAQSSSSKDNDTGKPSEEQLLQVIDRLTDSLINFFEKAHDYSMYHKNIVFQNNIKGVTIRGLSSYIQSMYLMRFYGYLHFVRVKVEILKVTHHTEDGSIRVRWRVNGLPRHKFILMLFNSANWKKLPAPETEWLDGFSIFSVGQDGLIFKHVCDKMMPDDDMLLAKKGDFKSKVLGLFGLGPRNPAGTLNALIPCLKAPDIMSCKKLT